MAINYECHYCHAVFPAEERIDGYPNGYPVGFLCPRCGRNIKDNLTAPKRATPSEAKWLLIVGLLFIPGWLFLRTDQVVDVFGYSFGLDTVLFGLAILAGVLIMVFVPATRAAPIVLTEPVEEDPPA